MELGIDIPTAATLLLVLMRVLGLCLVAPVLSHWALPVRVRVFAGIVIALAVTARVSATPVVPGDLSGLLASCLLELGIGAAIGYAARLVFAGIEMGAAYISQQMGIGLIEALNPMEEEAGTLRQLFGLLAIVIFLAVGGHRDLLSGLVGTFHAAPLAGLLWGQSLLAMMTGLLAASFELALKVALPTLVTLLLVTVALGLVQRGIPQLNLFSFGFPLYAMLGLLSLAGAMAVLARVFDGAWPVLWKQINAWTQAIG